MNITDSFEIINLDQPIPWTTIRRDDLIVNGANNHYSLTENTDNNDQQNVESLEIRKPIDLLNDDLQIVITSCNHKINMKQIYTQIMENIIPIFIYIIDQETLSDNDINDLRVFRSIVPNEPILFVRIDQSDM